MNAFTQDDFKGAYNSTSMQQLRSLADEGHAEARELLALEALGLSNNQLNLFSRFTGGFGPTQKEYTRAGARITKTLVSKRN